jgi:hypothetical protein
MGNWGLAPSTLAQWAGAGATFSAVLVALFKDPFIRYRRRPKLGVQIKPEPPDCLLSPARTHKSGAVFGSYWLRLWIKNSGRSRAEEVQVFVAKIYKRNAPRNS